MRHVVMGSGTTFAWRCCLAALHAAGGGAARVPGGQILQGDFDFRLRCAEQGAVAHRVARFVGRRAARRGQRRLQRLERHRDPARRPDRFHQHRHHQENVRQAADDRRGCVPDVAALRQALACRRRQAHHRGRRRAAAAQARRRRVEAGKDPGQAPAEVTDRNVRAAPADPSRPAAPPRSMPWWRSPRSNSPPIRPARSIGPSKACSRSPTCISKKDRASPRAACCCRPTTPPRRWRGLAR